MQVRKTMTIPVSFIVDSDNCSDTDREWVETRVAKMSDPEWGTFILMLVAEMFAAANHRNGNTPAWASIGFGSGPAVMDPDNG